MEKQSLYRILTEKGDVLVDNAVTPITIPGLKAGNTYNFSYAKLDSEGAVIETKKLDPIEIVEPTTNNYHYYNDRKS